VFHIYLLRCVIGHTSQHNITTSDLLTTLPPTQHMVRIKVMKLTFNPLNAMFLQASHTSSAQFICYIHVFCNTVSCMHPILVLPIIVNLTEKVHRHPPHISYTIYRVTIHSHSFCECRTS